MQPATKRLHEALIRLAKGMISAWEKWIQESEREVETKE